MDKHINFRLDEKEFLELEKVAKRNNMNISEAVRTSLKSELAKISKQKNKSLSPEDSQKVLELMGKIMTNVSKIQSSNAKAGSNINQLAKSVNQGKVVFLSKDDFGDYAEKLDNMNKFLGQCSEVLNKIWQLLV